MAQQFFDPINLVDFDLSLRLKVKQPAYPSKGLVPSYIFSIHLEESSHSVGIIQLRVGDSHFLTHYAGQVGFSIEPEFRGKRLASRSCKLLFPLAKRHGLNPLWITCNPENIASRRTCELAGGELVEIVEVPTNCSLYTRGERLKCRYRINL